MALAKVTTFAWTWGARNVRMHQNIHQIDHQQQQNGDCQTTIITSINHGYHHQTI
jgi:hypothetical protein